ncbi:UTP--glucose-1-phosphate uridylyltransferase [Corticibacter populi]|uniref:UTP--glucose-1-phosphate uridylyltransferase n=1 Tax=Corticibacter populi TaxID=1550736 RepID=A0A3M6QLT0_9BURK|nr:UTP--glucose-1-phosphate uridylyltransferase GalU [Corticibacter populi]RMX04048.1 UTP--glucose-1-phosphate uridylyltransferase [Corticibacter populi]RZS33049.1 UTP--glucose-1-phosphate uridylyltransferase [Corticibacter populi]
MSTTQRINKAVFPVAGFGTRFLPATKAQPKEMLTVVDKPLIQYAVEEAYDAGIRHMIFVNGRNKRAIEDHFDTAYELEHELEAANKQALLSVLHGIVPSDMECSFVRQPRMLGLGHAVLCARHVVGNDPFAVLLADDLMVATPSVTAQMVREFDKVQGPLLAVQEVPLDQVNRYGIVAGPSAGERLTRIEQIIEKPKPENAPSTIAVAGRYVLTPDIFDILANQPKGAGGEIQLTDAIATLAKRRYAYAYTYEGKRYDCGSKEGFLQATVELGLQHPQVGGFLREYLKTLDL